MANNDAFQIGEPAPKFVIRSTSNEHYHFHTVGGRYVVLCCLNSASDAYSKQLVETFLQHRTFFDDEHACFFGVSCDPADERASRLKQVLPGYRFFWDFNRELSRLYRVCDESGNYVRSTFVLDMRLRFLGEVPFDTCDPADHHVSKVIDIIDRDRKLSDEATAAHAPVLIVPRVFEPAFCRELVTYYESGTPEASGFMRERDGKTVRVYDDSFKRRRDVGVEDEQLRLACRGRLVSRLTPEVHKAFQFVATYAERYIVSRYDSTEGGFFKPHRDNKTKGTAHRRFAVTINLNTGEYGGGSLRFPEFGCTAYEAPLGGAIVFSCSLLHEAMPVTRGVRYAFLPFLYDEPAARVRAQNMPFVDLERLADLQSP